MELKDVIQQMIFETMKSYQPAEMQIGTVTNTSPLEITLDGTMQPLKSSVLYLTETVIEKSIPILEHTHNTPQGETDAALLQADITCDEHGSNLGTQGGRIIFNQALKVGDKVILQRSQNGQKFVIQSRVYNIDGHGAASGG